MKNQILLLTILIAGGAAGYLAWNNSNPTTTPTQLLESSSPSSTPTITSIKPSQAATASTTLSESIHWGAVLTSYALSYGENGYKKAQMKAQMDLLTELGATDVITTAETKLDTTDDFVNMALEREIKPVLILNPPQLLTTYTYESSYQYAKGIATRYKDKVGYYQLADEISEMALTSNQSGYKTTDYDDTLYGKVRDIVKGLSEGVVAADPKAKRVINVKGASVGMVRKLIGDKVNFEVAGWSWFSDKGNDLVAVDGTNSISIADEMANLNKELWVVEFNLRDGTQGGGLQEQSNFLNVFVTNVLKRKNVRGLFVYTLTDFCSELNLNAGNMGLTTVVLGSDNTCTVKDKKTSFDTFRGLIKANMK